LCASGNEMALPTPQVPTAPTLCFKSERAGEPHLQFIMSMRKRSSLRLREEGESRGVIGSSSQPDTMFVSTKLSWKGKYERVFAITRDAINTVDPKEWRVTNSWQFDADGVSAAATAEPDVFQLLFKKGNKDKDMKFATAFRPQLVGEILRLRSTALKDPPARVYGAKGLTRANQKRLCSLRVDVDSVVVCSPSGDQEFRRMYFPDISELLELSDVPGGIVIVHLQKPRLFAVEDLNGLLSALKNASVPSGLSFSPSRNPIMLGDYRKLNEVYMDDGTRVIASFLVYKNSPRHIEPVLRQMMITHRSIVQRDSATYALKSVRPLTTLLGVVRYNTRTHAKPNALTLHEHTPIHQHTPLSWPLVLTSNGVRASCFMLS
jgi:DnaJ family protein C protein 13